MREHFEIATWSRNAVADGELEQLREPLAALAHYPYATVAPGGWMESLSQLQAAALVTSQAQTLQAAAAGVAAMARVCGECHRRQQHELYVEPRALALDTPESDGVVTRMFRHSWAAERLWEGLVAPSDLAWRAGAQALARAPASTPHMLDPDDLAPEGFARALQRLRELGQEAGGAESVEERTQLYALTLATCAQCHEHNRVFSSYPGAAHEPAP